MIVFAGIDGTGEWSDDSYHKTFANSHVKKIYDAWPWPNLRFYNRGPSLTGVETRYYAMKAANFVKSKVRSGEAKGIFLAGYSRGGAAVIEVASWFDNIIRADTLVDCLVLFDAVDRSTEVGGIIFDTAIGKNVVNCIHAKRDPKAKSRESFGNCGTRNSARYSIEKEFFCTHGGLGGVPWTKVEPGEKYIDEGFPDFKTVITPAVDQTGAEEVWDWVNPKMRSIRQATMNRIAQGG